jgi:hypothetical protein
VGRAWHCKTLTREIWRDQMVDDSTCDDVICWADDQRAFHIWRPNALVETVIPKFFEVKYVPTVRERLTQGRTHQATHQASE